jgi:hypothetical protein
MWCISNNSRPTPNATQAMTIPYLLNWRLAASGVRKPFRDRFDGCARQW